MKRHSGWVVLAALAVAASALVLLQTGTPQDSPDHSVYSDGRNGTSALRLLAGSMGRQAETLDADFNLRATGTLFVFNPSAGFSAADVNTLKSWIERGGTAIYADDSLDRRLAVAFDLHKTSFPGATEAFPATPVLGGVRRVTTESYGLQYTAAAGQAVLLAGRAGRHSVIESRLGQGRLIAIATPELLCNGYLERADNAILAADLLTLGSGPALFDEFHHGTAAAGRAGAVDWTRQPLGLGLAWAVMAIFAALLVRGRAFGPRLHLDQAGPRSTAEYARAVGHLLRLAGGRSVAIKLLGETTRRRIGARVGLGRDVPPARLGELLNHRAPELGRRLATAEEAAATASRSEASLLRAARHLHDLAYPHPGRTEDG